MRDGVRTQHAAGLLLLWNKKANTPASVMPLGAGAHPVARRGPLTDAPARLPSAPDTCKAPARPYTGQEGASSSYKGGGARGSGKHSREAARGASPIRGAGGHQLQQDPPGWVRATVGPHGPLL